MNDSTRAVTFSGWHEGYGHMLLDITPYWLLMNTAAPIAKIEADAITPASTQALTRWTLKRMDSWLG
ncbi:MAG: hypothetical protein Ct9H300mP11_20220 [Chloroflexota bacterium]|nr:MAG: hypothetical protein Ct9H300mP11_20220 [Chloroflexota bacterium]